MRLSQRMQNPPPFRDGVLLDQDEHDQERNCTHLLITQLDLDRQFKHGINLVCAGVHANLLKVGICNAPLPGAGLGLPRMAATIGCGGDGIHEGFPHGHRNPRTFGGLLGRNRGAVTPRNRYPARGSARVTPMKHNTSVSGAASPRPIDAELGVTDKDKST